MGEGGHRHEAASTANHVQRNAHRRLVERADLAMRVAWLTVHAERMYDVDPGGLLSAQLLDLRDLIEALDRDGRVVWS